MIKFGFGKRAKPRTFDYKPRFYDPAREEREARLSKYRGFSSEEEGVSHMTTRIRSGLKNKWQKGDTKAHVRRSNMRLLYILIILFLLSFLLLSSNKITALLEGFSR